jgi:hypothetical protein
MTAQNQAELDNRLDGARLLSSHHYASLIVLGVALSIVIYVAVGLVWLSSRGPYGGALQMRVPIYVGALFLAMGAIVLRRTQLRWLKLETITGLRGVEGLLKYLVSTTIVLVVIAEVIGLLGLVICLLGGGQRDLLALGATGLVLALSTYPKRTAWEKTVRYLSADANE